MMITPINSNEKYYTNLTIADFGHGVSLNLDSDGRLRIYKNCGTIVIDCNQGQYGKAFAEIIRKALLVTHEPEIDDEVIIRTRVGTIHKVINSGIKKFYLVRFGDNMCREIINWHDKWNVFINPAESIMANREQITLVKSPKVDTAATLETMQLIADPKLYLTKNPQWASIDAF
jgi:hypothetical protein